jgi:hypothetical protein
MEARYIEIDMGISFRSVEDDKISAGLYAPQRRNSRERAHPFNVIRQPLESAMAAPK